MRVPAIRSDWRKKGEAEGGGLHSCTAAQLVAGEPMPVVAMLHRPEQKPPVPYVKIP